MMANIEMEQVYHHQEIPVLVLVKHKSNLIKEKLTLHLRAVDVVGLVHFDPANTIDGLEDVLMIWRVITPCHKRSERLNHFFM